MVRWFYISECRSRPHTSHSAVVYLTPVTNLKQPNEWLPPSILEQQQQQQPKIRLCVCSTEKTTIVDISEVWNVLFWMYFFHIFFRCEINYDKHIWNPFTIVDISEVQNLLFRMYFLRIFLSVKSTIINTFRISFFRLWTSLRCEICYSECIFSIFSGVKSTIINTFEILFSWCIMGILQGMNTSLGKYLFSPLSQPFPKIFWHTAIILMMMIISVRKRIWIRIWLWKINNNAIRPFWFSYEVPLLVL